jgi:hypothetical protein
MWIIGDGKMEGRKPDIYEKQDLADGRTVAMSIWVTDNKINIRISEKDKEGKWKQLLSTNLWKSGLR